MKKKQTAVDWYYLVFFPKGETEPIKLECNSPKARGFALEKILIIDAKTPDKCNLIIVSDKENGNPVFSLIFDRLKMPGHHTGMDFDKCNYSHLYVWEGDDYAEVLSLLEIYTLMNA